MTRSHASYALVFLAAATAAFTLLTAIGIASADSIAPPGTELVEPTERPSDALADPIANPAGAVDDIRREGHAHGWALGAIVGLVLISRALRQAHKRWPTLTPLRWMAGTAGLVVVGAGIIGSAAFDAFVFGGSWLAAGYAAIGAVLYLLDPDLKLPTPMSVPAEWSASTPPPLPPRNPTDAAGSVP